MAEETKPTTLEGDALIQACAKAMAKRDANQAGINVRYRQIKEADEANLRRQSEIERLSMENGLLENDISQMKDAIRTGTPFVLAHDKFGKPLAAGVYV
jgi:predicted RNase H-like nuclease (RuvC/YqgF family)